ncbi:MAG: hypothetical protein JXR97_09355 [Planctomycetes bacterium]|nr:hypothetical protein [Planctomycetota bacterium]
MPILIVDKNGVEYVAAALSFAAGLHAGNNVWRVSNCGAKTTREIKRTVTRQLTNTATKRVTKWAATKDHGRVSGDNLSTANKIVSDFKGSQTVTREAYKIVTRGVTNPLMPTQYGTVEKNVTKEVTVAGTCADCNYKAVVVNIDIGDHTNFFPFITNGQDYTLVFGRGQCGSGNTCCWGFEYGDWQGNADNSGHVTIGVDSYSIPGTVFVNRIDFGYHWDYCNGGYATAAFMDGIPGAGSPGDLILCGDIGTPNYTYSQTYYAGNLLSGGCNLTAPTDIIHEVANIQVKQWIP